MQNMKKVVGITYKVIALFALALLASAGMFHLTAGLDARIVWPLTVLVVAFLVRELL
jgi:hypothetical protein